MARKTVNGYWGMDAGINGLFIELLQVSLGTRVELSRVPNAHEWEQLLIKAEDQAIVHIAYRIGTLT